MKSLFSLLLVLLLPAPSMFYFLKHCTADSYNQGIIDCTRNDLSNIPSDIPKDATEINLDHNHIETIRQADLRGYTNLQTLSFYNNDISLIEDGAFLHLSSLSELDLSLNKLVNLTDNLFTGLSNLVTLDLKFNYLELISKFAFGPLKSLQYLSMEKSLPSDIVNVISHTPNIRHLYFSKRSLEADRWPFPLQKLTTLTLDSLELERFSVHTDVLPNLKNLVLSGSIKTEFEWDVPKNLFKRLKLLELSVSRMTTENFLSILQSVDSVESLMFRTFVYPFNQSVLDAACSIPALKSLQISFDNITFINSVFLRSCSRLTKLTFFPNILQEFAESSLRTLTRLKQLNVESNMLSRIPAAVRNMSSLMYLSFRRNHIRKLQCSDFSNLPLLRLLNLNFNRIRELKTCVLKDLKNLNFLFIENNNLSTLDDALGSSFPKLVVFSAKENYLNPIHKSTFNKALTLRNVNIKSKSATEVENGAFEGILNLNQLTFSQNYQSGGVFSGLDHLESLVVFVTSNKETVVLKPLTFNISSLRKMTIAVDKNVCVDQAFYHLHNMTHLQRFSLDTVCCVTPSETFSETPHLKNLKITNCAGFRPESELFQPISQLQFLDLSHNRINNLTFLSKANLTKLEKLILSNNALRIIDETVFKALPSLKYLNLEGNPFACDCANAGFIMWANQNEQVQVAKFSQYKCSTPSSLDGHLLLNFKIQICWKDIGFLYFLSSSALVVCTLLSSFLYHFMRWQLVYGFYLLRAFLYNVKKRKQGCAHVYDAFVSYNVHDEDWVYGELVPELEQRQRWKLCLHHRDFEPGKPIIENITDAIHSSRKTLCVISRHYLQSEWCSQEIQMASFRLFDEKKDVLILLFLEELSSNQLAPFYRIRKLVRSRTYLSWDQARGDKALFWEKVQRALEIGDNLE